MANPQLTQSVHIVALLIIGGCASVVEFDQVSEGLRGASPMNQSVGYERVWIPIDAESGYTVSESDGRAVEGALSMCVADLGEEYPGLKSTETAAVLIGHCMAEKSWKLDVGLYVVLDDSDLRYTK